jgi:hypothetical protein
MFVALFLGGAIGGYLAILFGWVAYADAFAVADDNGGKVISIAFTLAPLGGLLIGAGLASWNRLSCCLKRRA